jgi:hypothetical protein
MNLDTKIQKYTMPESLDRQKLAEKIRVLRTQYKEAKSKNKYRPFTEVEIEKNAGFLSKEDIDRGKNVAKEKQNEIKDRLFRYHDKFYQKALEDLKSSCIVDRLKNQVNTNVSTKEFLLAKKYMFKRDIYSNKSFGGDLNKLIHIINNQIYALESNKSYQIPNDYNQTIKTNIGLKTDLNDQKIDEAKLVETICKLQELIFNDPDIKDLIINNVKEKRNPHSSKYRYITNQYIADKEAAVLSISEFTINFPEYKKFKSLQDTFGLNYNIFTNLIVAGNSEYIKALLLDTRNEIQNISDQDPKTEKQIYKIQEMINKTVFKCIELESNNTQTRPQLVNMVAILCNLSELEAKKYLQSWLISLSEIDHSWDIKVGENITKLISLQNQENNVVQELDMIFNINDLARYPDQILQSLPEKYKEKKPYVLSVYAKDDNNGILYKSEPSSIERPVENLGNNGNMLLMEAFSYFDIIRFIKTRIDKGFSPPDVIIINAHGNQTGFLLSKKANSGIFKKNTLEKEKLKSFIDYLREIDAEIVLNSCAAAKGDDSFHKKTQEISLKVIAAKGNIKNGTNIILDFNPDAGKIYTKSVEYTEADTNYFQGHKLSEK